MKKYLFLLSLVTNGFLVSAQPNVNFSKLSDDELLVQLGNHQFSEKYQAQWDIISADNIVWYHRIWRTANVSDNPLLQKSNLNQSFGSILFSGIESGNILAYSSNDDRFTKLLNQSDVDALKSIDWSSVQAFTIKEDWMFTKDKEKVIGRVIGIAPVVNGKAVFWLYYPDIRTYLANYTISVDDEKVDNLDKVFYNHSYTASIDKRQ